MKYKNQECMRDGVEATKGRVRISVREVGGEWKEVASEENLVVRTGKNFLFKKLIGEDTTNYLKYFAFGTGTTPPKPSDTGLENPIAYSGTTSFKEFEEYTPNPVGSGLLVSYLGFLSSVEPVVQPVDITEVGLFTSDEVLYSRITFNPITKTNILEMRMDYDVYMLE